MISPFSSKHNSLNSLESSHLPILIANRGNSQPSSPDSRDLQAQQVLTQLARVQASASLISIIAIVSLVYLGHSIDLRLELPRLTALIATAVLTERAFSNSSQRPFSPKYNRHQTNLRRLAVSLQIVWILSELAFSSAFAPLLLAVAPSLALSSSGSLALCVLPLAAMVTLTGCLEFINLKILQRGKRRRRLSSLNIEEDDLQQLQSNGTSTGISATSNKYPSQATQIPHHQHNHTMSSDTYTTPPLSPADSYASGSSGALISGLPSPTGHCPSPDRASMMRYAAKMHETNRNSSNNDTTGPIGKDIYLMEHAGSYDTDEESMLFVHKILKPIKTGINDQYLAQHTADYKPLLQQLMAQSQSQHKNGTTSNSTTNAGLAVMQPCPPLFQPAVVATITVVKGKGNGVNNMVMNTNQPPVPIPVIS